MSKLYIICTILFYSLFIGVKVHAQYAGAKYVKGPSPKMEILQVDNRKLSTMVYMAYTTPDADNWNETSSWMNFGDKTFIQVEGSSKQYHMISTINMPINSEAENKYMMFDRRNQRHQFILEFEKIPEGKSFDIIEDVNNPNAFNFYGITYTPTDSSSYVDVDEFIAGYPVKEIGRYVVKGNTVSYVKFKDVVVNITPFLAKQYGKYYNMNICVQNFSKKSILFNPNNIKVEGYNFKVDKTNNTYIPQQVELQLLTYAEYDKIVKRKQSWNNFWVALGEGMAAYGAGHSTSTTTYSGSAYTTGSAHAYGYVGNTYGYANAYGSSYTTTYGQSTTRTYDGAAAYAAQQRANENYANYANSQSQIRQQLGDGYVKMNTVPSGADYSGYFNIKYKKITRMSLEIIIDGEVYPFTF